MTKSETINNLKAYLDGDTAIGNIIPLRSVLESAIKYLEPSLPSDLNEAAEEYAYNNWEDNDYHTGASEGLPFDAIGHTEKCFKAGAEWMAGQGVTREVEVKEDAGGYPYIDKHFELYDYDKDEPLFKAGDKVVVQIRKK